jgi:curved DNA-binding protein
VLTTLALAPSAASQGARVPVRTLGGQVELSIPEGSQAGRRMRLKGRGLPGTPPGDQIVTLQIAVPPATDSAARSFYEDMARRFTGFDPRRK